VHAAGYVAVVGRFSGEEEGKSMQPVLERVPLSLSLLHLYHLLNAKGCLDVGPRLSLSPFWAIIGLVSIPILHQDRSVQ